MHWILRFSAGRWLAHHFINYKAARYEARRQASLTSDANNNSVLKTAAEQEDNSKEIVMADLANVFDDMKGRFNSSAAGDLDAVFQYQIEDGVPYYVVINDGTCETAQGEHDDPTVTLMMDSETLQEVLSGETDGMQAFMAGRIRADGDIMLATRLTALFPVG